MEGVKIKIAYIILAHKGYEQLNILINQIVDDNTDIYIHIDKKNDELYNLLKKKPLRNQHVNIINERVIVNWSGFSQVEAVLNLLNKVKENNKSYDYVSLISGSCFPIKDNEYIRNFLTQNNGYEFIQYRDITHDKANLYRLKCYNFFRENKNIRKLYMRIIDNIIRRIQKTFVIRKNFNGMKLYHGSQWFTITYGCAEYILDYVERNSWFIEDFKYTLVPDEHFFQMIIMNSEYKHKVKNNNLRYIDWSKGGNSPKILTLEDMGLINNSTQLIARKFDIDIDRNILMNLVEILNKKVEWEIK